MIILRLLLLLVSTQYVCARLIAPRGSPLRFVPVAELVVRQDDSAGDDSGDDSGGNDSGNDGSEDYGSGISSSDNFNSDDSDTSQPTVQKSAQAPPAPQQQQQDYTQRQQQQDTNLEQQPQGTAQTQQQQGSPQQQQPGVTPQQQQQRQPAQPSGQQQQAPQQQQQQPQPAQQEQPSQTQQPLPQQSVQQPPFQSQTSGQAGPGSLFDNFLQLGGSPAGSSGAPGSVPSQGSSSGSAGSLDHGNSGNAIKSVGSGSYLSGNADNAVASAGVPAPSSGTASNTGGACSTPNGQGTCMSIPGGCSGGSFVPGYCSATSEECCVYGITNPAGNSNPSVIANPLQSPNTPLQVPSTAPISAALPRSSAGVYYGVCSSPSGQGNCVAISSGCGGGTFVPGWCPVGQNTECCVPNSAGFSASPTLGISPSPVALPQSSASIYYGACSSPNGQGNCVDISAGCGGGTFVPGWCPVGQNTECCVLNTAGSSAGGSLGMIPSSVAPPQSSASTYYGACSSPNGQGMCVSTSNGCNGGFFVPGWCPVGQGTECCVPNPSGNNAVSSLGMGSSMNRAFTASVGASMGSATSATAGATMTSSPILGSVSGSTNAIPSSTSNPASTSLSILSSTQTPSSMSTSSTLSASQTTNTASSTSNMYTNTTAQTGTCHSLNATEGYSGIASTSNYGNMGSACNCGGSAGYNNASWQGNSGHNLGVGQGYYSGAVNQKLFGGSLNQQGQPGCGQTCGSWYSLQTTGTNAYNGGPNGGSNIIVMVTDACYNNNGAPNWCSSNTDSGQDDYGCDVHFDIQMAGPQTGGGNGPDAVGMDGQAWTYGGAFVQYKPVSCPEAMKSAFQESCAAECPDGV